MIALIDYGAGNLTSVRKALSALGASYVTPTSPAECATASGVIVPGVGHFDATRVLEGPWRDAIAGAVRAGVPLLGICLGMQWLFEGSDEARDVPGLAALPGRVSRLRGDTASRIKIPHVGWNALVSPDGGRFRGRLLSSLTPGAYVYFTHSYAAPVTEACVASTTHAEPFASVVERDNVFGVQFHPEKSGDTGLAILRSYLEVVAAC